MSLFEYFFVTTLLTLQSWTLIKIVKLSEDVALLKTEIKNLKRNVILDLTNENN